MRYQYQLFLGLTNKKGNIKRTDIDIFINNNILNLCNNFTITKNIGFYNGKKERSLTLTIISEDNLMFNKLKDFSFNYKTKFEQDSVLISCNSLINYELIKYLN